jgi:hypothetical protein
MAPAPDNGDGWMPDALHVSNGDATDLAGTGLARRVLYWRDALHDGPVPAAGTEELRRIRTDFLARAHEIDRTECMNQLVERDCGSWAKRSIGSAGSIRPHGTDYR